MSPLCHPKVPGHADILKWFIDFSSDSSNHFYLPEIVSYEVKRGLFELKIKHPDFMGLERFEALSSQLEYLPLTKQMWDKAAELWAKKRSEGKLTASQDSLDGDVLLAAQALQIKGIIITENFKHLQALVPCKNWRDLL